MEERTVTLSLEEYNRLMEWKMNLELLETILFDGATLNYRKTDLTFDDCKIGLVLKYIDYEAYQLKMEVLSQKEKENDE